MNATVVGILPGNCMQDANPYCTVVVPTGLGHTRNSIVALSGDIIIAIGGAAGTLSEIAYSWIYDKPIIAYGNFDGWASRLAKMKIDDNREEEIIKCDSIEDLESIIIELCNERKRKLNS